MELDVKELLSQYHSLLSQYSSLEEVQMNLFNNLSNIYGMDWLDGNSLSFGNAIDLERNETDSFRMCVWEKIGIFKYIYNRYSGLGKMIRCNLDKKEVVLSSVHNCIISVKAINNIFGIINLNFSYPEFETLRNKRQLFINMEKKLVNIKEYLVALYNKIENIERDIDSKIRELEEFKVNSFEYSFGTNTNVVSGAVLQEELFLMDFAKYNLSKSEENKSLMKLYDSMFSIINLYKSKNVSLYHSNLRNYRNYINDISEKRNSILNVLSKVPSIYGAAIQNSINVFEEAEFND